MYQIIKGWPSEGAIDEIFKPAVLGDIEPGTVGRVKTDGEAESASYLTTGADSDLLSFFAIDVDTVTGNVTGLLSKCLIEVDADHYTGTFTAGDEVTAAAGLFSAIDTSTKAVGRVRSFDATSGKMKVLFYGE